MEKYRTEVREIMDSLRKGDISVFDHLFTDYYSSLVIFAVNKGVPQHIAEDIVQDIFFKLWQNKDYIDISRSFKSYFLTSVSNRVKDFYRHKNIKTYAEKVMLDNWNDSIVEESLYLEKELKKTISEAIDRLPEKCRKIFVMYKIQNLKVEEIAEIQGLSKRTVEGHLGKAYKLLRYYLTECLALIIVMIFLYGDSFTFYSG